MMGNHRQSSQEHGHVAPLFPSVTQELQAAPEPLQQHSPSVAPTTSHPLPLPPTGSHLGVAPVGYPPQHPGLRGPLPLPHSSGPPALPYQHLGQHPQFALQHPPHPLGGGPSAMLEHAHLQPFPKWQQLPPCPPTMQAEFSPGAEAPPRFVFPESAPSHHLQGQMSGVSVDHPHPSRQPSRQLGVMGPDVSPRSPNRQSRVLSSGLQHHGQGGSLPSEHHSRASAFGSMEHLSFSSGQQEQFVITHSVPSECQTGVKMDFVESGMAPPRGAFSHQPQFPQGEHSPHPRPSHSDLHMTPCYDSPVIQRDCRPSYSLEGAPTSANPPVFHFQTEGKSDRVAGNVPVIHGEEMEGHEHWEERGGSQGGGSTMAGQVEERPRLWCSGSTQKEDRLDEAISDSEPSIGADDDDSSSPELSPHIPKPVCRLRLTRSTHQDPDLDPECWEQGTSSRRRGSEELLPGDHFDETVEVAEEDATSAGFHPPKFKKRLHERYVSSLQTGSPVRDRGSSEERVGQDRKRERDGGMGSRGCKSEGDDAGQSSLMEPSEGRACDTPDNDVFMEPSPSGSCSTQLEPGTSRPRSKPSALGESEPLDLSRATLPPPPSGLSPHSPGLSPDLTASSPGGKPFSPVNFRSPHRLPYPTHGLLSPQSPLCSVPEGGRIFNFNVPSPFEGPHSDSDLLSPSPMSPRIFQFPPHGAVLSTMSEVNRLAVSPRALYHSAGSLHHPSQVKAFGGGSHKDDNLKAYYEKRSLSESDVTYLCPICGQVFPAYDNLAKHMAKHLPTETIRAGDNNKIHYCKVCNRSFSRSDMLTRHMRLHTGLKPYECNDCGQVFSRSDHLNTHRRTHTGEKPYRCPHCPYAACRRDMITRHMRTHAKRSAKRGRFLSVPEPEPNEVRKSSVSSTETTDSQEQLVRTCSVSSVESADSESHHKISMDPMGTSGEEPPPALEGGWILPKQERIDPGEEDHKPVFGSGSGLQNFDPFSGYRKPRNWSVTSMDSVASEDFPQSRHDSVADDTFLEPGERLDVEDSPLDPDTLKRCTISADPFPR